MSEPLITFEIDPDRPGDREEIVEALVAVLLSARERRHERAAAEREVEHRLVEDHQ